MNVPRLERLGRELLEAVGEDPDREGLRDTPRRFAAWWGEFLGYDPGNTDTTFESVKTDQMVVVRGLRIWSLCEHHLLPFWCDVSIGYIARDRILGLSKFGRIAKGYGRRLQVQERLVDQIAAHVESVVQSPDVAVLARGKHLCMAMRGVEMDALGYISPGQLRDAIQSGEIMCHPATGAFCRFRRRKKDGVTVIYEIAVPMEVRGRGIARRMIDLLPRPIELKCPVDNESNGFYQHLGFEFGGTVPGKKRDLNIWRMEAPTPGT